MLGSDFIDLSIKKSNFAGMFVRNRLYFAASASLACTLRSKQCSADDPAASTAALLPKDSASDNIGDTPLIYLRSVSAATGCHIFAKAEWMNPTGSIKDRTAKVLIGDYYIHATAAA